MIKIMIVDDEYYEREAFKLLISNDCSDCKVVGDFENGEQALNFYKDNDVDLIFMDIKMPIMDGIEATQLIKAINKQQYVIILTAYADFEVAQQAVKINANDFLLKPARLSTIQTAIQQFRDYKTTVASENQDVIKLFKHALLKGHYLETLDCIDQIRIEEMYYDDFIVKIRLVLEIIRDVSVYFSFKFSLQQNKEIHEFLMSMKRKGEYFDLIESLLRDVFAVVINKKLAKYKNEMAIALDYIELNLTEDVTLESVASYMNISPHYFSKIFKRDMEVNFIQYVTNRKIERAMKLLTMSNQSIINIAYELGFNEANYFSRVFKKNAGMTPYHYRKEYTVIIK